MIIRTTLLGLAIGLLSAMSAQAATDEAQSQKLYQKYATDFFEKAKAACVCLDGGAHDGELGVLRQWSTSPPRAACYHPIYNSEGGYSSEFPCNGAFTILGK